MNGWYSKAPREKLGIAMAFLWERFNEFIKAVRGDHIQQGAVGRSHDFLHAVMVANYCMLIAEEERTALLAWVAALCHNTDRLWPNYTDPEIEVKVRSYLKVCHVLQASESETKVIIQAVLDHHKPNSKDDNPITVVLKDADRIANMGPNMIIRAGQHYPKLPAYDPRFVEKPDPRATYHNPMTVLHDVLCAREWYQTGPFGIRLHRARQLARKYDDFLYGFKHLMARQLIEVGLDGDLLAEDFETCYAQGATDQ